MFKASLPLQQQSQVVVVVVLLLPQLPVQLLLPAKLQLSLQEEQQRLLPMLHHLLRAEVTANSPQ